MRRFVLNRLKEASGPITSLDVASAWIADRGPKTDHGTAVMIRKRVGCLTPLQAQGVVHGWDTEGVHRNYGMQPTE